MGSERLYRTEGIVIRRRDQGEADRVLTLCTPQGKLDVVAKGARKVHSRKAGHIELFTRANFVISRVTASWDIVSQADMVEAHALLRSDLVRGTYARYVIELYDRFFAQEEGGRTLFELVERALLRLSEDADLDLVVRVYEQEMLALAGFRPELFRCVGEHTPSVTLGLGESPSESRAFGFDAERGGVLCPVCYADSRRQPEVVALSSGGLRLLQQCQTQPYGMLRGVCVAESIHDEAERAMQHHITYHLERSVRSLTFLRQLRRELITQPRPAPPGDVQDVQPSNQ